MPPTFVKRFKPVPTMKLLKNTVFSRFRFFDFRRIKSDLKATR